jgi:hypothetical protein
MSKLWIAAAAALAVVATAPASARTQNADGNAAAAGQKKQQGRKICRTFENSSSRLKAQRVCLTKEQWKKFETE